MREVPVELRAISKRYGGFEAVKSVSFSLMEGELCALIGENGAGKSTLIRLITGLSEPSSGTISMFGQTGRREIRSCRERLGYMPDLNASYPNLTARDNLVVRCIEWGLPTDRSIDGVLSTVGLGEAGGKKVKNFSMGMRRRLDLAIALLGDPELLILDEPTNHLDSEMADWLEEYLKKFRGALLMITHDRYFLDSVTNRIVELDKGKLYSYQTNYEGFVKLKAERMDMAVASERKRQTILRTELAWMQRGARARSTKQKAHIQRYEALRDMDAPEFDKEVEMESISSRLGRTTVEVKDLCKAYGNKVLLKDFTYIFLKNDRVGIIGPNGSGKSTLMKMIAGWVQPDSGTIEIGQTVKIGYFSQENEAMDESLKVIDYIRNVAEYVQTKDGSISASQMLERFLFPGSVQYTTISRLSGGEKRRLYLLRILMDAPNVLLLDEPTNDLDIRTLMILEDYLDSFQGIVITVSHDRYFLDRMVRRIFAFEGDGKVVQYEGGFTDYQAAYLMKHPELSGGTAGGKGAAGRDSTGNAGAADGDSESGGAAKKSSQEGRAHQKKLKFSFKEQREWDTIEDEIAGLEADLETLDGQIAESATNYGRLNQLMTEKAEKEALLEEKMDRWMYLQELAEKIAAQS